MANKNNLKNGFYSRYINEKRPKFLKFIDEKIEKIQEESFNENFLNQLNVEISTVLQKNKQIKNTKITLLVLFLVFLVLDIIFIFYYLSNVSYFTDLSTINTFLGVIGVLSCLFLIFLIAYIWYLLSTKKSSAILKQKLDQYNFQKRGTLKDFLEKFNPYEIKNSILKEIDILISSGFPINQNPPIKNTNIRKIDQVSFFKPFLYKYYEFASNSANVCPINFEFGVFKGLPFLSFSLRYQKLINFEYTGQTRITWTEWRPNGVPVYHSEVVTASFWLPKPIDAIFEQTYFKTNVDRGLEFSLSSSNQKISKQNNNRIKVENQSFNEHFMLTSNNKVSAVAIFDLLSQEKLVNLQNELSNESITLEKLEDNLFIPYNARIAYNEEFSGIKSWIAYDLSSWTKLSEEIKSVILYKFDNFFKKFSVIFEILMFRREIYLNDGKYQQMDFYQADASKLKEELFTLIKYQSLSPDLDMIAKQYDVFNSGFIQQNYLFRSFVFPSLKLRYKNYFLHPNLEILTIDTQVWNELRKIVYARIHHWRLGLVYVPINVNEYSPKNFYNDLVIIKDKKTADLFFNKIRTLYPTIWIYSFQSRNQFYFCLDPLNYQYYLPVLDIFNSKN